jgi:hypothetical protein
MKKILTIIAVAFTCSAAMAQVGTTIKDGAAATGQKAEQYGDQAKAAVQSQPKKTVTKAKAQAHKAAAHTDAAAAKDAAKDTGK